ncbi:MAG TPA: TIR domain-containing protein, partial [Propionibacteriaceae bacterium]
MASSSSEAPRPKSSPAKRTQAPRVYLSYRRRDALVTTERLADRLAADFQVTWDISLLDPDQDFESTMHEAIATSDVVLAIIGPRWASAENENWSSFSATPDDWVVAELTLALSMGIPVIPVLVEGADLLSQLPRSLTDLAHRRAAQIRSESFAADVDRLLATLRSMLAHKLPSSAGLPPSTYAAQASATAEFTALPPETPSAPEAAPDQAAGSPTSRELDDGAVFLMSWADAVRQAQGHPAGGRTDLMLGALAAARATIDQEGEPYDPAAWALVQSLATPQRPLRTILDEALQGLTLPGEPDEADPSIAENALYAAASTIAEETGDTTHVAQRHLLAATLMSGELPEALTTTLGADRTDLGSRLLEAITHHFPGEDAAAWNRILGPGDLESPFFSDMVPSWRRRAGVAPPPLVDRLGLNTYVSMLATMIARRTTAMPVSIGLFGEWGSGKSYFMGLLRDRVDELRKRKPNEPPGPYHEEIVQITFNAWSYADTNLWASLAADFFTQLGDKNIDDNDARRAKITEELLKKNQFRMELSSIKEAAERRTGEVRSTYAKAVADRESRTRTLNASLVHAVITDPGLQDELGQLST